LTGALSAIQDFCHFRSILAWRSLCPIVPRHGHVNTP
jgi:hypothetical protein